MFAVISPDATEMAMAGKSLGLLAACLERRSTFVRLCVSEKRFVTSGQMAPKGHPRYGGRTKGVPNRVTRELKSLAQAYGPEALRCAVRIMRRRTASDQAKLAAVAIILDRAYGRPAQNTEINLTGDLNIESMSDRQLAALIARLEGAGPAGDQRPLPN